jgi:ubiquinone/menaquinone biosynthesis C-methylase UbiE
MLLNNFEFLLMNNPIRAALQRRVEAPMMRRLGGDLKRNAVVLEIGCGRGVGVEILLNQFQAANVHAFDLDSRMIARAQRRHQGQTGNISLWTGDAVAIPVADSSYDAVFDFGILHHVPDWYAALREIARVLKPGGMLYAEEMLRAFLVHPVSRRLFAHPQSNRFGANEFVAALQDVGFERISCRPLFTVGAWFTATRPLA